MPDRTDLPMTMDEAVAFWLDEVEQVPAGERELNIFERARRHLERRGWSKYSFLTPDGRVTLLQALADVFNTPEELRAAGRELALLLGRDPDANRGAPTDALIEFNEHAETTEIDLVTLLQRGARRP